MEQKTRVARFWHFMGTPFRAIVALNFKGVRSLFSIAMLCGIVSLSFENWALVAMAHHLVEQEEFSTRMFALLLERTRFNSGLQAWFALILGLIVVGAEFLRAKWGDKEIEMRRPADTVTGTRPELPLDGFEAD